MNDDFQPMASEDYNRYATKQVAAARNTMSKSEYFKFVVELCKEMLALVKAKNTDYTAGTDDPFANFRSSEELGVEPLTGLNIRILDKIQRIKSFSKNGNLQSESLEDAYKDLIGYSWLALGMLKEKKDGL